MQYRPNNIEKLNNINNTNTLDSIDIARRAMIASSCINYKEALKATRDYKDKFNSLKEL